MKAPRVILLVGLVLSLIACNGEAVDSTEPTGRPQDTITRPSRPSTTLPTRPQRTTVPSEAAPTTAGGPVPTAPVGEPTDVEGSIGYVGCSMTENAIDGYTALGGTQFWPRFGRYGGGTVGRWAFGTEAGSRLWAIFRGQLREEPDTAAIWWQLCTFAGGGQDDLGRAMTVLEEIRASAPDLPVYVSPQPSYTEGHVCEIAGDGGPERMAQLAADLVATGEVLAGPPQGPLSSDVTRDGCHADTAGEEILGEQLATFFMGS